MRDHFRKTKIQFQCQIWKLPREAVGQKFRIFGFCTFHEEFASASCKFVTPAIWWFGFRVSFQSFIVLRSDGRNFILLQWMIPTLSCCCCRGDWPLRIWFGSRPLYLWEDSDFASWPWLWRMLTKINHFDCCKVAPEHWSLGWWPGSGPSVESQVHIPGSYSTRCRKCWAWWRPSRRRYFGHRDCRILRSLSSVLGWRWYHWG